MNTQERAVMQQARDALDLSQALLEKSSHHKTILDAYTKLRQALEAPAVVEPMIPKTIPDRTALIDLIAEHLSGTYHCTRVWSAWRVGTMSQDDFADVGESDTPSEITEAIIATLISQQIAEPAAATGWKWVPLEPTAEMLQAGQDAPVSESDEDALEDYKAVYRAMLAAAAMAKAVQPTNIT